MTSLKPLPGHVLVELRDKYEYVAVTEQKYDTKVSGILIDYVYTSPPKQHEEVTFYYRKLLDSAIDKRVFWDEYKDGATIERDGKRYAFVKIEDLQGYEDEQTGA